MKKKLIVFSLCAIFVLSLAACGDRTGYPEDGQAIGEIGDTMHTAFFDFTINSAELADSFDGYTPAEGYELLVRVLFSSGLLFLLTIAVVAASTT